MKHGAYGFLNLKLVRDGQVIEERNQPNLLMWNWQGGGNSQFYTSARIGANSPAPYDDMDGTYTLTAGVVARASGSGTFTSNDVGRSLKFGNGVRCIVTAYTDSTHVTVGTAYDGTSLPTVATSVSATTLRRYNDGNVGSFASGLNTTLSAAQTTPSDLSAGTNTRTVTATLSAATSDYTCESILLSTSSSATPTYSSAVAYIKLNTPLAVLTGDQLVVTHTTIRTNNSRPFNETVAVSDFFTGWPYRYPISAISGNGTTVTATLTLPSGQTSHHFAVGDKISAEIVPVKVSISSATSTAVDFTINTATAHGKSVGDSVVIEDASVTGYNGTWTVATVPDSDTLTIASSLNPGAMGASGTLRLATPGTYFNGEVTLTAVAATTVSWSSAVTGPTPDTASGIITSPDRAKLYTYAGTLWDDSNPAAYMLLNETHTGLQGLPASVSAQTPSVAFNTFLANPASGATISANATPTNGSGGVDGFKRIKRFCAGQTSNGNWVVTCTARCYMLDLETPQPKFSTFSLQVPASMFRALDFKELP